MLCALSVRLYFVTIYIAALIPYLLNSIKCFLIENRGSVPKGFPLALATFGCLCGAFYVRGGAQPLGRGFAPAGASKGFPLALATFGCLCGAFLCGAAHSRWGRGFAPAGASKGFPLALATFGCRLLRRGGYGKSR